MTTKNDTGKDRRVVLNLNMTQAEGLVELLDLAANETIQVQIRELAMSLKTRLRKTINKHKDMTSEVTQ